MGSKFFRHPAKMLDREFRAMGATRADRDSRAVTYRFPDGAYQSVPTNIGPANARGMLNELQYRYGPSQRRHEGDPLAGTMIRDDIPTVDTALIIMTKHATERFEQMSDQARLSTDEIRHCLQFPETVRYSPSHSSWMWVRGRIAVATTHAPDTGETIIRTVLWATEELWVNNPRPEKTE
jgi:hypothetical protein